MPDRMLWVLVLAGAFALSGCVSIDAPRSGSDTLLVVPIHLDRSAAGNWDGQVLAKYVLKITSTSDASFHAEMPLDPNGAFSSLRGMLPGKYRIDTRDF